MKTSKKINLSQEHRSRQHWHYPTSTSMHRHSDGNDLQPLVALKSNVCSISINKSCREESVEYSQMIKIQKEAAFWKHFKLTDTPTPWAEDPDALSAPQTSTDLHHTDSLPTYIFISTLFNLLFNCVHLCVNMYLCYNAFF